MGKILVADTSSVFANSLRDEVGQRHEIMHCGSGEKLLQLLRFMEPDVLVYDTSLKDMSPTILSGILQALGMKCEVVIMCYIPGELVLTRQWSQRFRYVLPRPCTTRKALELIESIICRTRETMGYCLENELDTILLSLGFRMGPHRYKYVFDAVLIRYHNPHCAMKELYIDTAKCNEGNNQGIEKALRDAIEDAYNGGNRMLWEAYFQHQSKRSKPYPSNEDFVARIAGALTQKARVQKLYSIREDRKSDKT